MWLGAATAAAEPVSVRYREGTVRGFLVLRTMEGTALADGDLIQTSRGARVTARLVFRFRDGSVHDEVSVFSQQREFRLIRYRLIQKGPAFPRSVDMTVDGVTGQVTVRYTDDGEPKIERERFDVPTDLSNGILPTLLKNVNPARPPRGFAFIVATPKPRMVKLEPSVAGAETFTTGATRRQATHFVVKVDIGGITGWLAEIAGKDPPDSHVWILSGEAPAFVKSEQPLYPGGPLWRIELAAPAWPRSQP